MFSVQKVQNYTPIIPKSAMDAPLPHAAELVRGYLRFSIEWSSRGGYGAAAPFSMAAAAKRAKEEPRATWLP